MAGNGDKSGDGKTSPFTGGSGGTGNDFLKNPGGAGGGSGNNFLQNPEGKGEKGKSNNFVEKAGGSMSTPDQKTGSYENKTSVPAGGKTPFIKGGTEPAPSRKDPKGGFAAGGGPGDTKKPYKVSSR
jgi:hypothetical protein